LLEAWSYGGLGMKSSRIARLGACMREGLVLKHLFSLPHSVAFSLVNLWVALTMEPAWA
jgi:hypothetical protein